MTLNSHALVTPPAPTLPYELWLNILRYFELRPLKFGHIKPDAGFAARRSVLWSLCLTSHRLLDIARPLLYANIVLPLDGSNPSARRCLRLIRTASQSPRICQLVVSLAVPLQLMTNPRLWESAKSLLPLGEIHKDHKHLFQTVHLLASSTGEITTSDQRDIIQRLVALLICLLPRLQSLLIYAPFNDIVASRNLGTSLEELLGADTGSLDEEMQKLSIAQESRPTVFDRDLPNGTRRNSMGTQSPLQRLKTLQLLQDCTFIQPGSGDGGLGPGDGLSAILPILKVRSGRLDRLDLSEYYLQDMNSSQAAGHAIAKIKEINLINLGHPGEVTVLLRAATTLDTLSLSLSQHVDSTQSSLPPPTTVVNDDYNNAILARRDSLRSLSFTAPDFDPLELGYLLGPLGRLTCLAQLDGLQFLRVEPQLLIDWLEVNTWPRFMDNLPKNLATLAFRFRTSNEDMSHVWARSGLGAALASGDKWRKKLPFLQVIVLEPLPYSTRVTDELAEGLRLHGISLTWVHEV